MHWSALLVLVHRLPSFYAHTLDWLSDLSSPQHSLPGSLFFTEPAHLSRIVPPGWDVHLSVGQLHPSIFYSSKKPLSESTLVPHDLELCGSCRHHSCAGKSFGNFVPSICLLVCISLATALEQAALVSCLVNYHQLHVPQALFIPRQDTISQNTTWVYDAVLLLFDKILFIYQGLT